MRAGPDLPLLVALVVTLVVVLVVVVVPVVVLVVVSAPDNAIRRPSEISPSLHKPHPRPYTDDRDFDFGAR